ncbi:MAG: ice-binding family protein [Bacteroidota bacterium]|nr:ice-binding family protein [Bacteroidota bacterium]
MKNANVQTITRSAIRPAVIMSISLAMFLFAACESNSPSSQQDISGPVSEARTVNKSVVSLDAVSNLAVQTPVNLGLSDGFAILSYAGITNTGSTSITGNIGASPITGASLTGFETVSSAGTTYTVDAAGPVGYATDATMLTQAMLDLTAAYNDAAGRTSADIVLLAGNLGGQTLPPGLYKSNSTLEISSGDLTLDARGDANAVWIFQIASSFNMTSGRQVFLIGGAKASNIFWQVGSSATFGTTAVMKGTILAYASSTFATGASLEGRALARTANVTLDANSIVKP